MAKKQTPRQPKPAVPQKIPGWVIPAATLALGAVGFGLRTWCLIDQLAQHWQYLLLGYIAAAVLVLLMLSRLSGTDNSIEHNLPAGIGPKIAWSVGGFLLLLAGGASLLIPGDGFHLAGSLGMVLSGGCLMLTAKGRGEGAPKATVLPYVWTLGAALWLVDDFRSWSRDPLILEYAPRFLTAVAAMLGLYQLGAFFLNLGNRRHALCTTWTAAVLAMLALPDVALLYGPFPIVRHLCFHAGVFILFALGGCTPWSLPGAGDLPESDNS